MLLWWVLYLRLPLVACVPSLRSLRTSLNNIFFCTAGIPCENLGPLVPPPSVSLTSTGRLRVQRSCNDLVVGGVEEGGVQLSSDRDKQDAGLARFNLSADGSNLTFGFLGFMDRVKADDSYELCWCQPDAAAGQHCSNSSGFTRRIGYLQVAGVKSEAFHSCFRGQKCTMVDVAAVALQAGDRLAPLQRCARGGAPGEPEGFVPSLPGLRVMEKLDARTWGFVYGPGGDPDEVVEAQPGIYTLCFCRPDASRAVSCTTTADYRAPAGYLAVTGPYMVQSAACWLGTSCSVSEYNGVRLTDEDRLTVRSSCADESSGILPSYVSPLGSMAGTAYRLGNWPIETTRPGTYQLCWCAGGLNCSGASGAWVFGGRLDLYCPRGYYNNGTNCHLCDNDNYCTGDPAWPRMRCPSGSSTKSRIGAWDPSHCLCRPGYFADSGLGTAELHCLMCPPGRFAYEYGVATCRPGTYECVLGQSCQGLGPMQGGRGLNNGSVISSRVAGGVLRVQKRCAVEERASRVSLSQTSPIGNATLTMVPGGVTFGFGNGSLEAAPLDAYALCWCFLSSSSCTANEDFYMELGQLIVAGPDVKEWSCTLGRQCVFEGVTGVDLRAGDRLTVDYNCGVSDHAIYGLPGTGIAENSAADEEKFRFDLASGTEYIYSDPGIYRVCFCRPNGPDNLACDSPSDFKAHVGYLTAEGPQMHEASWSCTLESDCLITGLRGVNLKSSDKILLTKRCGEDACGTHGVCLSVGAGNPPSQYNLGTLDSRIPPGEWDLCWCSGDVVSCDRFDHYRMKAGTIEFDCSGNSYINSEGNCAVCCTDCFMVRFVVTGSGVAKQCNLNAAHILYFCVLAFFCPLLVLAVSFFFGPLVPLQDIERDEEATVVTVAQLHFVLSWAKVPVCFRGTYVPWLDSGKEKYFATVRDGNELVLLDAKGRPMERPCDTSRGEFRILRGYAAIYCGVLWVPFAVWAALLLAIAIAAVVVGDISAVEFSAIAGASVLAVVLFHFIRRRRGLRTQMVEMCKAYRRRLLVQNPKPQSGPRGACRALKVEKLIDLHKYFQACIRHRNMYYICPNIVMPLTRPEQLSFADLAGPSSVDWFVSHFWGMPFKHFVASITKHAQSVAGTAKMDWKKVSYWVCTFSNNQWKVKDEVGNGDWQESSFYKALRSGICQGTAMVLDDQALPLTRSWCLFEVLQTRLLEEDDPKFAGLKLCTSSGVLNNGTASMDVATALARKLQALRLQDAGASCLEDKQMIEGLVESMPGGFETMNDFVRDSIRRCLLTMKGHFDVELARLVSALEESTERLAELDEKRSPRSDPSQKPDRPEPLGHGVIPDSTSASATSAQLDAMVIGVARDKGLDPEVSLPGCMG